MRTTLLTFTLLVGLAVSGSATTLAAPISVPAPGIGMGSTTTASILRTAARKAKPRPSEYTQPGSDRRREPRRIFFENCWWTVVSIGGRQHYQKFSCPDLNNIRGSDIRRPDPLRRLRRR